MSAAHDDTHRCTRSWRADGQKGVIGTRRAAAYHDRVHLSTQRIEFAKMKREETNLDVLKVEPRPATPAPH